MKEKILAYIVENLLNEETDITSDTPLYTSGLITSMGHLKLVNYLERTFDLPIPMNELSMENFDTVNPDRAVYPGEKITGSEVLNDGF
jgi:acyl carrier protein